jgi:hypothetical protein
MEPVGEGIDRHNEPPAVILLQQNFSFVLSPEKGQVWDLKEFCCAPTKCGNLDIVFAQKLEDCARAM